MTENETNPETEKFLLHCPACDDYFFDNADFYEAPDGMKYAESEIPHCPICGNVME